ncbi:MAG: carbohydrate-binding domain-containing protein [Dorea sp.]
MYRSKTEPTLITSGGDGIKSTNTDETDKGYVIIDGGTFTITAEGDGIRQKPCYV